MLAGPVGAFILGVILAVAFAREDLVLGKTHRAAVARERENTERERQSGLFWRDLYLFETNISEQAREALRRLGGKL